MKEKTLEEQHKTTFDASKYVDKVGMEFWYARDLQKALDYSRWEKLSSILVKAQTAFNNSRQDVAKPFHHVVKMVSICSRGQRINKHFDEMVSGYIADGGLL